VARHRILVISAIFDLFASKTSAAAVPMTCAVASQQDLTIYLTGLGAVRASFAEGENGRYKLRQNAKVTTPAPVVAKQAQAS
jgi:hypothetical protein